MKMFLRRSILVGILCGFLSLAHASNQWLQVSPGDTWEMIAVNCPSLTVDQLRQFNSIGGVPVVLETVSSVKCPRSDQLSEQGHVTQQSSAQNSSNTATQPQRRNQRSNRNKNSGYHVVDGSVGGEYRSGSKERQRQINGEVTSYNCTHHANGDITCGGPRIAGQYRETERKSDGRESDLYRARVGYAKRKYHKSKSNLLLRDTGALSAEVEDRENSTMLNAHLDAERKVQLTERTAVKVNATGRVPITTLSGRHRDTTAVGVKGEVQYELSKDPFDQSKSLKAIGSLGLWHSFHNSGTTSLTPKVGLRLNNSIEVGVGVELIDGRSPTDIFYAKKYFHKDDRKRREKRQVRIDHH